MKNRLKKLLYRFSPTFRRLEQINQKLDRVLNMPAQKVFGVEAIYLYTSQLYENGTARGVTETPRENPININLTTIPHRLPQVHLTIESLLRQSLQPDRITLWLEEDRFPEDEIPVALRRQQERGLSIERCKDLRSYKKLIPALNRYPNDFHATCDDDVIYPRRWLEKLYSAWHADPNCVTCHRCHRVVYKKDRPVPYRDWEYDILAPGKASHAHFATGVGGVLYFPGCFGTDAEVLNESQFMTMAPRADDVWFRAMTLRNDVRVKMVDEPARLDQGYLWEGIYSIPNTQKYALYRSNHLGDENDTQLRAVLKHYDLYDILARGQKND